VLLALEGVVAGGTIGVGVVTNGGTTGLGKGVGTGGTIGAGTGMGGGTLAGTLEDEA